MILTPFAKLAVKLTSRIYVTTFDTSDGQIIGIYFRVTQCSTTRIVPFAKLCGKVVGRRRGMGHTSCELTRFARTNAGPTLMPLSRKIAHYSNCCGAADILQARYQCIVCWLGIDQMNFTGPSSYRKHGITAKLNDGLRHAQTDTNPPAIMSQYPCLERN